MSTLIVGLVVFLGAHAFSIVAPAARERIVARIGAGAWRGIYSLVSLLGLVLIVHGYALARAHPIIVYVPPLGLHYVTAVLMLAVFPLLFAAYLPGRIQRATKHPMLLAVKVWALAHLLANGALADLVLFGSFMLWAGLDRMSLKRRAPRPLSAAPPGPANDLIAVLVGLGVYAAFVLGVHRWLFGVAPLAGL